MIFKFKEPVSVGDLQSRIEVGELELCSLSLNFEPERSENGTAILSVVLVHRDSSHKTNSVYKDESALEFWNSLNASGQIEKAVFAKLTADNKLPDGELI
jgi:hypothetical protein